MFEKFVSFDYYAYKKYGSDYRIPNDRDLCAIILNKGNVIVADVVFDKVKGTFSDGDTVYEADEVDKYYVYWS